ncbi:hypothetical protein CBR_g23629 [Chara braunii]|uniref:DUF659 domain-containing protein n=1 Tax=Chara braunii TaxID=69332 RepID=A0A388L4R3_CHABU|nr:hypothetical protein CBR_g23629 [Chara braunii]|eukprot:GBG77300.1 hypothetical protein CBR_g23629 [Chara braunii]
MWTCSSLAKRNWAIHESMHTKNRNRLLFPKVVKLVEITANTRLLALQSAGGGLVLPWTQDESMLDVEGGLEADAVCEGVDHNIPEEDRDAQAQLWQRDVCGSRPPPPVEDVFGVRAATLRLYPKDDSSADERAEANEGFRPHGAAAARRAEDGDGAWSDPEEVCRWGAQIRDVGRERLEDVNREMGIGDVAGDVASGLGGAWLLGNIGTLGALPGSGHAEQLDDADHEGAPHDEAGGGDHAMESASMRNFMVELEATLPSMTEGESIVARQVDEEHVGPRPWTVHMEEPTLDTEEERMAREAREDEEEATRAKALADADPRTLAMARDMEAMLQLDTGGEGVRGDVAEDDQMEGSVGSAHAQTLEFRGLIVEAAARISHAVQEREGETPAPDIDSAPIVPLPPDKEADAVAVAHDGEACCEIVIVDSADTTQSGDLGAVPGGDVEDEEAVWSLAAVGGDVETGGDMVREGHGDVGVSSTIPGSCDEDVAGVMAPPPIRHDASTATLRPSSQRSRRRPPRYVEQPRGSLMFSAMSVDELGACLATDLTGTRRGVRIDSKKGKAFLPHVQFVSWGLASPTPPSDASVAMGVMGVGAAQSPPSVARDRGARPSAPTSAAGRPRERGQATAGDVASLLGRTDIPWSNTRRSTASTKKRQPGLGRRRSSTSSTREVHAVVFEHRGGSGAEVDGAGRRGSAALGARVSTHGLREISQILEADVLRPPWLCCRLYGQTMSNSNGNFLMECKLCGQGFHGSQAKAAARHFTIKNNCAKISVEHMAEIWNKTKYGFDQSLHQKIVDFLKSRGFGDNRCGSGRKPAGEEFKDSEEERRAVEGGDDDGESDAQDMEVRREVEHATGKMRREKAIDEERTPDEEDDDDDADGDRTTEPVEAYVAYVRTSAYVRTREHFTIKNNCAKISVEHMAEIWNKTKYGFDQSHHRKIVDFLKSRGFRDKRCGSGREPAGEEFEDSEEERRAVGGGDDDGESDAQDMEVRREVERARGKMRREKAVDEESTPDEDDDDDDDDQGADIGASLDGGLLADGRRGQEGAAKAMKEAAGSKKRKRKAKRTATEARSAPSQPKKSRVLRQTSMLETFDPVWQRDFSDSFLQWWYVSGIPFEAARRPEYQTMRNKLLECPPYAHPALPTHRVISCDDIPQQQQVVADMVAAIRRDIEATRATILTDGRKSITSDQIVNFLAAGPTGAYLFRTVQRDGAVQETAEAVVKRWKDVFDKFGVDKLVLSDIAKDGRDGSLGKREVTIIKARAVVHFIREHGAAMSLYRRFSTAHPSSASAAAGSSSSAPPPSQRRGRELVYPVQTRFATHYLMLERLLDRCRALEALMMSDDWSRNAWRRSIFLQARWVHHQVRYVPFWEHVEDIVALMTTVMQLLRCLDRGGRVMTRMWSWGFVMVNRVARASLNRTSKDELYIVI